MNKTILIIDDDKNKVNNIGNALFEKFDNPNIMVASSRNDGLLIIMQNKNIDLIILDWNFPVKNNEFPEPNMGLEILEMLDNLDISMDVIICSSEINESIYEIISDYPNVIGTVQYDSSVKLSFEDVIGKGRVKK